MHNIPYTRKIQRLGNHLDTISAFIIFQKAIRLSQKTIKNRVETLNNLQNHAGETVETLNHHQIRAYLGREGIKQSTAQTERSHIKAYYRFLAEEEYRTDDPCQKVHAISAPRALPRPFTREQIEAMLNSGCYKKTRAIILLGYFQGLRRSEIAAFHPHQMDLTFNSLRVTGKGNKESLLPLRPEIRELAKIMPKDDWWFPSRTRAGHVDPDSISDLIRRAKIRAGIRDPKLTAHSLRHSFGTELVESEVDIRVVQELMRHETIQSTQIYTLVSQTRMLEGLTHLPTISIPQRSGRKVA